MVLTTNRSVALMTVIIIIFILTILASVMLSLLANQTRLIEHDISRTKAKYATEAAMVDQLDYARKHSGAFQGSVDVSGRYDDPGQDWDVDIISSPGGGLFGTDKLDINLNYSTSF